MMRTYIAGGMFMVMLCEMGDCFSYGAGSLKCLAPVRTSRSRGVVALRASDDKVNFPDSRAVAPKTALESGSSKEEALRRLASTDAPKNVPKKVNNDPNALPEWAFFALPIFGKQK